MARERTVYVCSACGGTSTKWLGRCPHCEAWNTLQESRAEAPGANRFQSLTGTQAVATLSQIAAVEMPRTPTGQEELDRALGGGIVPGGVVLIGGDPGIGKSTLLLQAADSLSRTPAPGLPRAHGGDPPDPGSGCVCSPRSSWRRSCRRSTPRRPPSASWTRSRRCTPRR